jgi:hypothetical protein
MLSVAKRIIFTKTPTSKPVSAVRRTSVALCAQLLGFRV